MRIPVACELGEGQPCYIQSYMDHDPGPDLRDFTCQWLTHDGHKGTDFALRSHAAIATGIPVIAAAAGTVTATRDGMEDRVYTEAEAEETQDRDCGNGVVIAHADGWETQYCHLRKGSVAVEERQTVAAGDVLGMVGMSGRATFPHLHLSLRKDGVAVDPYAPTGKADCSPDPAEDTLWSAPPSYRPGGLIAAGFAPTLPDYMEIKAGLAAHAELAADAKGLALWGFAFGGRAGDRLRLEIVGPQGETVFREKFTLETAKAQFAQAGLYAPLGDAIAAGTYTGHVQLERGDATISTMSPSVTVSR